MLYRMLEKMCEAVDNMNAKKEWEEGIYNISSLKTEDGAGAFIGSGKYRIVEKGDGRFEIQEDYTSSGWSNAFYKKSFDSHSDAQKCLLKYINNYRESYNKDRIVRVCKNV